MTTKQHDVTEDKGKNSKTVYIYIHTHKGEGDTGENKQGWADSYTGGKSQDRKKTGHKE